MEKDQRLLSELFPFLQGHPQPSALPEKHLLLDGIVHPAPGAADGTVAVLIGVIEKDLQRGKTVFGEEFFHLCLGGKPEVVVPFQQDLRPRELVQKGKILFRLTDVKTPGNIPGHHYRILRADVFPPVFFQLFHIAGPSGKHIHGLVDPQRKVKIRNGK